MCPIKLKYVLSDGSCQAPFPLFSPSLISPFMYNPKKGVKSSLMLIKERVLKDSKE